MWRQRLAHHLKVGVAGERSRIDSECADTYPVALIIDVDLGDGAVSARLARYVEDRAIFTIDYMQRLDRNGIHLGAREGQHDHPYWARA